MEDDEAHNAAIFVPVAQMRRLGPILPKALRESSIIPVRLHLPVTKHASNDVPNQVPSKLPSKAASDASDEEISKVPNRKSSKVPSETTSTVSREEISQVPKQESVNVPNGVLNTEPSDVPNKDEAGASNADDKSSVRSRHWDGVDEEVKKKSNGAAKLSKRSRNSKRYQSSSSIESRQSNCSSIASLKRRLGRNMRAAPRSSADAARSSSETTSIDLDTDTQEMVVRLKQERLNEQIKQNYRFAIQEAVNKKYLHHHDVIRRRDDVKQRRHDDVNERHPDDVGRHHKVTERRKDAEHRHSGVDEDRNIKPNIVKSQQRKQFPDTTESESGLNLAQPTKKSLKPNKDRTRVLQAKNGRTSACGSIQSTGGKKESTSDKRECASGRRELEDGRVKSASGRRASGHDLKAFNSLPDDKRYNHLSAMSSEDRQTLLALIKEEMQQLRLGMH